MLKPKLQYFGHLMWTADPFGKTLMLGKIEGKKRKGQWRVRWLDGINGHEFEQTPGESEGQGSLGCCSPWNHKEQDTTEQLKNYSNPSKTLQTAESPNILLRVKKLGRGGPSHCFIFPQRWLLSSFVLLSLSSSLSISLEISHSSERVSDTWPPRALCRGGF